MKKLHITDDCITKKPSLWEEDSPWKVSKIIPLIDTFVREIDRDEINLLDVGGGAGLILNVISAYIKDNHKIKVNKFALDLSPGALDIQKMRNPDLKRCLNEDISKTSLADKEIDLTLMIDVLEHVVNPTEALKELRRISKFVIFKVPLDDNLYYNIMNFITRGKVRQTSIESSGHINIYRFSKLKQQIEKYTGVVLEYRFTDAFDYYLNSELYHKNMGLRGKLMDYIALGLFKLSPRLCSLIFADFAMILVKCY